MPSIEKPCIRRCCLDKNDICMGCFRTFNDMKIWRNSNNDEKHEILRLAKKRHNQYLNPKFCTILS